MAHYVPTGRGRGRPKKNPDPISLDQPVSLPAENAPPAETPVPVRVAADFKRFLESDDAKAAYLFSMNDDATRHRMTIMCRHVLSKYLIDTNTQFVAVTVVCNDQNNSWDAQNETTLVLDVHLHITREEGYRIRFNIALTGQGVTTEI